MGANGLKREGCSTPPSRNPSTLVLGRTIDLIIPVRGTDVNRAAKNPIADFPDP